MNNSYTFQITNDQLHSMNYKVPFFVLVTAALLYYFSRSAPPLSEEQLDEKLHDKVVLICGASSGIGEELAYQLAPHGAKLVLVARNQDKLDAVRDGVLQRGGSDVKTIRYDFTNVKESSEVINQTVAWFGKLDYLVGNHAALKTDTLLTKPIQQDSSYVERIFKVNILSHIELALQALPYIEESHGHMFFTSSIVGEIPSFIPHVLYSATKHAMNGFFYSLQQELMVKESPVSLTIGAFDIIATKKVTIALEQNQAWYVGNLKECAQGIMESYIRRPQTMSYPKISVNLKRFFWAYHPSFHATYVQRFQQMYLKGINGTVYEATQFLINKTKMKIND